jgi:hypothetical protein
MGVFKSTDAGTSWQATGYSAGGGLGPATRLTKVSGDFQAGLPNEALRYSLVVVVTNAEGIPVAGVPVDFSVPPGGGSLSAIHVITDSQGVALTNLTLGPNAANSTVIASSSGLAGSPLTFIANRRPRSQLTSD